jgi:hypothetical protein
MIVGAQEGVLVTNTRSSCVFLRARSCCFRSDMQGMFGDLISIVLMAMCKQSGAIIRSFNSVGELSKHVIFSFTFLTLNTTNIGSNFWCFGVLNLHFVMALLINLAQC